MLKVKTKECPICNRSDAQSKGFDDLECDLCGCYKIYEVTREALKRARQEGDLWLFPALSAATKQENFRWNRGLTLTPNNIYTYANSHRWSTVAEKLHKVLEVARKRSTYFGAYFEFKPKTDYPLFNAISAEEGEALINQIEKAGLIESSTTVSDTSCTLTHGGWEILEPMHADGMAGRCFIAMAFDAELDSAYHDGIRPAVISCGYDPICLKEVATNDDICDLILSELRKAQFVVADFTKQKGGVYFEAGFGKALGKEVFWTCRSDDFDKLHFDTNHYGHIKWDQPADLREQLERRIMAEIGRGPHWREGEKSAVV
jgi:hypothetical protein